MASPTASATTALTYSARRNIREAEIGWQLSDDALICEAGPLAAVGEYWPKRVPYAEISAIRVRFDPTRFDTNRYRCDLRGPEGARYTLYSSSYAGFADFTDQGDSFSPFVRELMARVQRARPSAEVTTGLSWPAYLLQHGLVLIALLVLVTVLGIAGMPGFGSIWVKLALVVGYAGMLWRHARRNWPQDLSLPSARR